MSEDIKLAIEKRRRKQIAVNAFHRTFATKDGKLALEILKTAFKTDQPAFLNVAGKDGGIRFDPLCAAKRDGQRDVILQVEAFLSESIDGDANIKTAKPKVRTA